VTDLRLGRWQDVLRDVHPQALIFDAPYSHGTHSSATTRNDDSDPTGLTPEYESFGVGQIREFCESWAPRCPGWWVSITDSELHPVWRDEMARVGRYAFRAPVPIFIPGMSVRIQGDGPSSWTLYAAVSRPMNIEFARWGTLPGYYGPIGAETRGRAGGSSRGGGRGKQRAITDAFVRDYTRKGDLVADPFAGYGGTLASALAYGRSAIGAEMDPEAYAEAQRRLASGVQVDMFGGAV
jgi:hypothetical protein